MPTAGIRPRDAAGNIEHLASVGGTTGLPPRGGDRKNKAKAMSIEWINDDTAAIGTIDAGLNGQALGSKGVTDAWDANTELSVPVTTRYLHVATDVDVFLITDTSADDPSTDPAYYPADKVHTIECRGHTKLHYKAVTAEETGTIYVTAFAV